MFCGCLVAQTAGHDTIKCKAMGLIPNENMYILKAMQVTLDESNPEK